MCNLRILLIFASFVMSLCSQPIEWVNRYDNSLLVDAPFKIVNDEFGNVYVTGISQATSTLSGFVTIKYNSLGSQLWIQNYFPNVLQNQGSGSFGIDIDEQGNVYVSGEMGFGPNYSDYDILTLKYSSNGTLLWENRTDGGFGGKELARDMTISSDGYIYVSALVENGSQSNAGIFKINPISGITIWSLLLNEFPYYDPRFIKSDSKQNVYINGYSRPIINGNLDCFTAKIDKDHNLIWRDIYDGGEQKEDLSQCINLNSSDEAFITGTTTNKNDLKDIISIKYNTLGQRVWENIYNDNNSHGHV